MENDERRKEWWLWDQRYRKRRPILHRLVAQSHQHPFLLTKNGNIWGSMNFVNFGNCQLLLTQRPL